MTNLTEQWKKSELPAGRYWVKYRSGKIDEWDLLGGKTIETKPEIIEVLAPVPSYEKWIMTKNLSERAHLEMYKARGEKVRLEKENTKLKELLKECSELMDNTKVINIDVYMQRKKDVLNSINQVLREE